MSGLFSSPKVKKPAIVKPATDDDEAVKAAAMREADILKKRRGAAATIVTGNTGVTGTAPGTKATLG